MDAKQCRMARAGLNLSGRDLARVANVGYATIARFEAGAVATPQTLAKIERALADGGAAFFRRSGHLGVTVPE